MEGLKFPFHAVTFRDGSKFLEQTVREVKLNTHPDPSVFSKPQ